MMPRPARFPSTSVFLGALGALLAVASASAQESLVREGTLAPTDPIFDESDGRVGDAFTFEARTGQLVTVTLRSGEFDTFLRIESPSGMIREDDDSGGGTDSQLSFLVDQDGSWTAFAASFGADAEGAYTLTWSASDVGETTTHSGRLGNTSPKGQPYDSTSMTLGAGTVTLMLSQPDQAYLVMHAVDPDGQRRMGASDGNGALLTAHGASAGEWTIWVGGEESMGVENMLYSLTAVVAEGGSAEEYEGRLDDRDMRLPFGEYADMIEVDVEDGAEVMFELTSDDFDTFLVVESAGGAPMVKRNDDGESTFGETSFGGSSVSFDATETTGRGGTWKVWVTSYSPMSTGDYVLRVMR